MSKFLIRTLLVTGGISALLFIFPVLLIFGYLALYAPGLVLTVVPTVFIYTAVFAALWFPVRRWHKMLATPMSVIAVALTAIGVPLAVNILSERAIDEEAASDITPSPPLGPVRTIGIEQTGPITCEDLCLILLYNGVAERVVVFWPSGGITPIAATLFRIDHRDTCDPDAAVYGLGEWSRWTKHARDVAKAVRLRSAVGECPIAEPNVGVEAELTIRRVDVRPKDLSRLSLAPYIESYTVELVANQTVVARGGERQAKMLTIPLFLTPLEGPVPSVRWQWSRWRTSNPELDALELLRRFTTFDLSVRQIDGGRTTQMKLGAASEKRSPGQEWTIGEGPISLPMPRAR